MNFLLAALLLFVVSPVGSFAGPSLAVHLSYHWHLHQPIYWPAPKPGFKSVQLAADSYDLKRAGLGFYPGSPLPHPLNHLAEGDIGQYDPIFSKEDRVRIYQTGGRDSLCTLLPYPNAGATLSYTGSLMDNVWSWGRDERMNYHRNWNAGLKEAMGWKTNGGNSRADLVGITYHHALVPLIAKSVFRKELELFKTAWVETWETPAAKLRGFFPPEVAFSESLVPELVRAGFQWAIVANHHLARTARNYLDKEIAPLPSSSSWNTNPPNLADQSGPEIPARQWWSGTIDGRGAKLPAPFAYQPHRVQYIDPGDGTRSEMVVVPMDDVLSYINGYGSHGTELIDKFILPFSDPARPSLVLLAHDGDNAWGGGHSYYFESVPGLARDATQKGYQMTVVQDYLDAHPVPTSDVVHVEDGGWVNPEGDWGDPQFVKWLFPPARSKKSVEFNPKDPRTFIDPGGGFSSSWRAWAVLTAGANVCETAEQIIGSESVSLTRIRRPDSSMSVNAAELAWHYYLAGLDSGFLYYGEALDDEVKQALAVNEALKHAAPLFANGARDTTPPTIFRPQRWPHNPGGMGWGITTGYQPVGFQGKPPHHCDFYVWTLGYDISGIHAMTLKVRTSRTGATSPAAKEHHLYAGGAAVGEWKAIAMQKRAIDIAFTGEPASPSLDYFIQPKVIADPYWAKVTGYRDVLLDYYIEATDANHNTHSSDIFHVWVGHGEP